MTTELLGRYKRWMEVERDNSETTIETMIAYTKDFLEWLEKRNQSVDMITQDVVNDYLIYCRKKYSHNSLVPITANLRKFLKYFMRKAVDVKIAKTVPPDRDKTPLTKKEIEAIFMEASGDILSEAILKTLYYTGIRISELINLDIEDVDFHRLQITIKHGKGNRSRTVNITSNCAVALQRWLKIRPKPKKGHEAALFISSRKMRISKIVVTNAIKKCASLAGITKQIYPHKFRISMITHMAESGCTVNEIQAQSGHRKVSVLLEYVQHSSERIKKAYERVFEKHDIPVENNVELQPKTENEEYYKKIAFEKYLNGELDLKTLNSMLHAFDGDKDLGKKQRDISYG